MSNSYARACAAKNRIHMLTEVEILGYPCAVFTTDDTDVDLKMRDCCAGVQWWLVQQQEDVVQHGRRPTASRGPLADPNASTWFRKMPAAVGEQTLVVWLPRACRELLMYTVSDD